MPRRPYEFEDVVGKVVYFDRKGLQEKAKAREYSDSDKYLLNWWVSKKKEEMIDKQRKDIWPLIENEIYSRRSMLSPLSSLSPKCWTISDRGPME